MCRKTLRVNEKQPQTTELKLSYHRHVPDVALEFFEFFRTF